LCIATKTIDTKKAELEKQCQIPAQFLFKLEATSDTLFTSCAWDL